MYELGDGEWDIPRLRLLLEKITPDHGAMEEYEVEHEFPRIGRRVMLLKPTCRRVVTDLIERASDE